MIRSEIYRAPEPQIKAVWSAYLQTALPALDTFFSLVGAPQAVSLACLSETARRQESDLLSSSLSPLEVIVAGAHLGTGNAENFRHGGSCFLEYSDSEKFFAFRLLLGWGSVKRPTRFQICALRESHGTTARSLEICRLASCSILIRSRINLVLVVRRE